MKSTIPFLKKLSEFDTKCKLANRMLSAILILAFLSIAVNIQGQLVTHPLSGITTTASFHSYIHPIGPTTGIEIKYFLVKAPNGDIKSAFDACDVCWAQYKGYVQVGTFMRCVNCGNTYPINSLGSSGTGGCWPAYLPHVINGTDLEITKLDMEGGKGYFQTVTITGVSHDMLPDSYLLRNLSDRLILEMPNRAKREVKLIGLNGKIFFTENNSSKEISISKLNLTSGIYVITIKEGTNAYYQRIMVD